MAPVKTLSFRKALITGGNSGLGRAMAESLIAKGKSVIIVGRTEKTLAQTAKEIGAADYFVLDVAKTSSIKPFINDVLKKHPDLDCLINNAGVQKPFQVLGPEYSFDLDQADQEIDINIRAPLHLCVGMIQHFNSLKDGAVIMNVGSVLGWNPSSIISESIPNPGPGEQEFALATGAGDAESAAKSCFRTRAHTNAALLVQPCPVDLYPGV